MNWALQVEARREDSGKITGVNLRIDTPDGRLIDEVFTPSSSLSYIHAYGSDSEPDAEGWAECFINYLCWSGGSLRQGYRRQTLPGVRFDERQGLLQHGDTRLVIPLRFANEVIRAFFEVENLFFEMCRQHRQRVFASPCKDDPDGDPRPRVTMPWARSFHMEHGARRQSESCAYCERDLRLDDAVTRARGSSQAVFPSDTEGSLLVRKGLTRELQTDTEGEGAYDLCADRAACLARGTFALPEAPPAATDRDQ